MGKFQRKEMSSSNAFVFIYSGVTKDEMNKLVDDLLKERGYKVQTNPQGYLEYEKGNRMMRLFFGAFCKYFKFAVRITEVDNGEIALDVRSASSGVSGGVIGMKQITDERNAMLKLFSSI